MIKRSEITLIGKFHKTHALMGELNAVLDIDASFLDTIHPLIVDIDGIFVPFYCESVRQKGTFSSLIKIQGIDTEEDARSMVNKEIYALKKDVAAFENEDNADEEGGYADDFIGFKIEESDKGKVLGEITGVDLSTANALFIVETEGGEILYIPVAEEFINYIDEDEQVIGMTLPEGLTEINVSNSNL